MIIFYAILGVICVALYTFAGGILAVAGLLAFSLIGGFGGLFLFGFLQELAFKLAVPLCRKSEKDAAVAKWIKRVGVLCFVSGLPVPLDFAISYNRGLGLVVGHEFGDTEKTVMMLVSSLVVVFGYCLLYYRDEILDRADERAFKKAEVIRKYCK